MKDATHILWDFNGTLLDDVRIGIDSINILLSRYGLKTLGSLEEYRGVFGFPIIDYYKRIGFDFDKTPFSKLAVEWVDLYNSFGDRIKTTPNAEKALQYVRSRGVKQTILTASEVQMVNGQLSKLGIGGYFDGIIGQDNIHAYGKTEAARIWFDMYKPARAILIGDTEHDAETAGALGIDCLLVSCGHQPYEKLKKLAPVFSDPYEAVKYALT